MVSTTRIYFPFILCWCSSFAFYSWNFHFPNGTKDIRAKPTRVEFETFPQPSCSSCPLHFDLDVLVKPFNQQHCLFVIDNYVNVDVTPPTTAVIIRFPKPVRLKLFYYSIHPYESMMWSTNDALLDKYINPYVRYTTLQEALKVLNGRPIKKDHIIYYFMDKILDISVKDDLYPFEGLHKNFSDLMHLFQSTSLHPEIYQLVFQPLQYLFQAMSRNESFDLQMYQGRSGKLRSLYADAQDKLIINSLVSCNKFAFILSEPSCQKFKEFVDRSGKAIVDIDKEVYFQSEIGIDFVGSVSLAFVKRLGGMQQSGIVDRWQKFLSNLKVGKYEQAELRPVKITGNIVVIFSVMLCGELIGGFVFIFETRWIFARYVAYRLGKPMLFCANV